MFPQYKKQPLVDFRSSSIPFSGKEFSGAYRKKIKGEQVIESKEIEVEDVGEENQGDEEVESVDLEKDFGKFKISEKKKRIKKKPEEKEIIYLKEKEIQKKKASAKKQRSCRKSRKNMKF